MFPPMSGVTSIQPLQRLIGGHIEEGGVVGDGRDHAIERHDDCLWDGEAFVVTLMRCCYCQMNAPFHLDWWSKPSMKYEMVKEMAVVYPFIDLHVW
jgi:hypothetical protein